MPTEDHLPRRSFLAALGAFALAPHIPPSTPLRDFGIPDSALPEEVDRIHRIIGNLMEFDAPTGRALLWGEIGLNEGEKKSRFMLWTPETEEELAAADRFRKAVAWRPWADMDDLRAILSAGGSWLVRVRAPGQVFAFVAPAGVDGGEVVGSDTSELGMSGDPAEALAVCSVRAEEIIRAFLAEGIGADPLLCIEPVRPTQPWRDGRYQCFARPGT